MTFFLSRVHPESICGFPTENLLEIPQALIRKFITSFLINVLSIYSKSCLSVPPLQEFLRQFLHKILRESIQESIGEFQKFFWEYHLQHLENSLKLTSTFFRVLFLLHDYRSAINSPGVCLEISRSSFRWKIITRFVFSSTFEVSLDDSKEIPSGLPSRCSLWVQRQVFREWFYLFYRLSLLKFLPKLSRTSFDSFVEELFWKFLHEIILKNAPHVPPVNLSRIFVGNFSK